MNDSLAEGSARDLTAREPVVLDERPAENRPEGEPTADDALAAARAAYARHAWPEAHSRYREVDAIAELTGEDLDRFAEATWWLADLEGAIDLRERAYAAHLRAGRRADAARSALWLVMDYGARLKPTLARGALSRAKRLLADEPESTAHAQLAVIQAVGALERGDHAAAHRGAQSAAQLSRSFGDPDLENLALIIQGKALVARGDVEDGLALMDEAAASAVGGELEPFTTGVVYCITIDACASLADYRRAEEWTEAAERWCHHQAMPSGFPGVCRVRRAEVKRMAGVWTEAEEEARRAVEELQASFLDTAGAAHYEIGQIRLRLGDLDGAEEAFRQAYAFGHDAQPGVSALRLAQGKLTAAAASIRDALAHPTLAPLRRAQLLPVQVEIALANDDGGTAAAATEELAGIAERYHSPSPVLRSTAAEAQARVALHAGDASRALGLLQSALRGWREVRAPYETARVQVLLAQAHLLLEERDAATLELETAGSVFDQLGAQLDARAVRTMLAGLRPPARVARTFLFTDIVTSTDLLEVIGDEAWGDVLRWHDQTLAELFRAHGGEVANHTGDGFFVAFTDAGAALECAVTIQRRLTEHRREHGYAPAVRIGVHAAEALHGATYLGRGVHEAARIAALAEGGQILASSAALEAAGQAAHVAVSGRRTVTLKGVAAPVEIAEVVGVASAG
jgi:class 3 adenylate cyclase